MYILQSYTLDQIKSQMILFIYMLQSKYTVPIISFLLVANPAGEQCGAFSSQRAWIFPLELMENKTELKAEWCCSVFAGCVNKLSTLSTSAL